jgi:hypothetical protein
MEALGKWRILGLRTHLRDTVRLHKRHNIGSPYANHGEIADCTCETATVVRLCPGKLCDLTGA